MNRYDLAKFDWGTAQEEEAGRKFVTAEIFNDRAYEKIFEVEEGDVVLDIGASIGPFTFSILPKNPSVVHCIEPVFTDQLINNTKDDRVNLHNFFIGDVNESSTLTFTKFIKDQNIKRVDFLKTDCEGGEYSIFNEENFVWIIKNVKKIVGEWHLWGDAGREKFVKFRDLYLRHLPHHVFSVDGVDIKWDLWNQNFLDRYTEVIIHIDNR